MPLNTVDTATLIGVQRVQKVSKRFFLETFFKKQINFDTGEIAFDRVNHDYRKLAPFVAPNAQGKVLTTQGYDTLTFKPAYVKPKHVVDMDKPFVRMAGESLVTGSLSPEQRHNAIVANLLWEEAEMIRNRWNWMAARALIDGSVTVSGENYPTTTVSFQRDAGLTNTLAGAAKWDTGTATVFTDLRSGKTNVANLSGAAVRDFIFGANAWELFSNKAEVVALLNRDTRGSETEFNRIRDALPDTVEYMGSIVGPNGAGLMRLYVCTEKYVDENGSEQDMMHTSDVVGVAMDAFDGYRCFGAIASPRAGFASLDMVPRNWIETGDPEVEYVMTQSAPLMVPGNANASFKIRVA